MLFIHVAFSQYILHFFAILACFARIISLKPTPLRKISNELKNIVFFDEINKRELYQRILHTEGDIRSFIWQSPFTGGIWNRHVLKTMSSEAQFIIYSIHLQCPRNRLSHDVTLVCWFLSTSRPTRQLSPPSDDELLRVNTLITLLFSQSVVLLFPDNIDIFLSLGTANASGYWSVIPMFV